MKLRSFIKPEALDGALSGLKSGRVESVFNALIVNEVPGLSRRDVFLVDYVLIKPWVTLELYLLLLLVRDTLYLSRNGCLIVVPCDNQRVQRTFLELFISTSLFHLPSEEEVNC